MFTPGLRACGYKSASGLGKWLNRDPLGEPGFEMMQRAAAYRTHSFVQGPAERIEGPNLYEYVRNNPVNKIDPLGLWQFTIGGGWEGGALLTFGHNSGQWNFGLYAGGGAGLYGDFDSKDSGCHDKGLHTGWKGKGGIGDELWDAEWNAEGDLNEGTLSGSLSHTDTGTGMDVNVGGDLGPDGANSQGVSVEPTSGAGAGAFIGVGGTYYW